MYLEHFGFRERPFSNAPDLRFAYLGAHHEQALAQPWGVPKTHTVLAGGNRLTDPR